MLRKLFAGFFLLSSISISAQPSTSTPEKPLPPGPMQAKIKAACTQCHSAGRITEQHMTKMQWSDQLDKMEGLGAVIPEGDRDAMIAYLVQNFGPVKGAKPGVKKSTDK